MADINATDLTQETASTMDGNEQIIMFDSAEGKRATVKAVGDYIIQQVTSSLNGSNQTLAAALSALNSNRIIKTFSLGTWSNAKAPGDTIAISNINDYSLFLFISGGANGYYSYITAKGYVNTPTNNHVVSGSKSDGTQGTIKFHIENNNTLVIDESDCAYGIRQVYGLFC